MNLYKLVKFKNQGVIPTQSVTAKDTAEWELRICAAHMLGMTDANIEAAARKLYQSNIMVNRGAGCLGNETWERNCHQNGRYHWVDRVLPLVTVLQKQHSKKHVLMVEEKETN